MNQPGMQEPAAAFQSLSGRKAREDALRNLAAGLNNAEWRILASELAQKTPKYDILGHLPAELVAAVCSRLCPVDIYSGRQVSKQWNLVLSSEPVCQAVVQNHFIEDAPRLLPELDTDWKMVLDSATRCAIARDTGRPYSKATHKLADGSRPRGFPRDGATAYCNGKVAYVADGVIHVLDLRTGLTSYSRDAENGLSQSDFTLVGLSERMVVGIDKQGQGAAFLLDGSEKALFSIPAVRINTLVVAGLKFAAIQDCRSHGDISREFQLLTWDFNSEKLRTICLRGLTISLAEGLEDHAYNDEQSTLLKRPDFLLLHPSEDKVILLNLHGEDGVGLVVVNTTTDLDGVVVASDRVTIPEFMGMRHIHVTGSRRVFKTTNIHYGRIQCKLVDGRHRDILVAYDLANHTITTKVWEGGAELTRSILNQSYHSGSTFYSMGAVSKEQFHVSVPTRDEVTVNLNFEAEDVYVMEGFNGPSRQTNYGDRQFLVGINRDGILAWCFDEDVVMANEYSAYRKERRYKLRTSRSMEGEQ